MAEKTFKLEIVSPEKLVLSLDVASAVVPGADGSIGILANHAPLMAEIGTGRVIIRDTDGNESSLAISGGFVQVQGNTVRILADSAEVACDIDVERAEAARRRAEERLLHQEGVDRMRAESSLRRALNRLRIANHGV
jgi:F-type H+-transporting ATPase subunit epsilon